MTITGEEWARRYLMFQLGDLKKVLHRIATHNEIDLDHITQQMTPEQVVTCDRAATDLRNHILAILDTPEGHP